MPFKNPHPLYSVWQGMKRRCDNPNYPQFRDYGGRGIKVCDRWLHDFHAFVADIGPRPGGYSLERINTDGDYDPENCRWASHKEQRNQRRTIYVEIEGVRHKAIELAERSGLKVDTIVDRAAKGMTFEQVMAPERYHYLDGFALGPSARKAKAAAKTHCRLGHELTPENTYVTKQGWRQCRACHNAKMRRLQAAKRARQ